MSEKDSKTNKSSHYNDLKKKDKLTYSDIEEMVERLVSANASKWSFDGFTAEDIGQEIRKKCFSLLDKWNKDKPSGNPIWFFKRSVHNHVLNLKRDYSHKNPNYTPKDKYNTKAVASLESTDGVYVDEEKHNELDYKIINEEILSRLSPRNKRYYSQMLENMSFKGVPQASKKKIIEIMQEVMGLDTDGLIGDKKLGYIKNNGLIKYMSQFHTNPSGI